MKIALSTDHAGFKKLQLLERFLESQGYSCINFGPDRLNPEDDYPDYIRPAAQAVANGDCDFGIIFGGSGQGEAMVANRIKGVRCGVFYGPEQPKEAVNAHGTKSKDDLEILRLNREHNDANMLSLAGRFLSQDQIEEAVALWLSTPFSGQEHHLRRVKKIDD